MISAMLFSLGMTFTVILAPGVFLLAALGLQCLEFFYGVFPGELAGLDGRGDFLPGRGGLVASAFLFTLGFTLGRALVATLALGGFPGILASQAFLVGFDGFFESCIGILLGDFAFLDKPVAVSYTHLTLPTKA